MIKVPKNILNIALFASIASAGTANAETAFSGFYAGGALGYQSIDVDWNTAATYDPSGASILPSSSPKESLSDSSETFGAFLGYNFMLSEQWLLGAELAYSASDFEDDIPDRIPGLGASNNPNSYSEVEAGDEASFAARLGYLLSDDVLVYGSLSIREIDVMASSTCPADTTVCNPSDGTQTFSDDSTLQGWGLGAGVEKSFGEHLVLRGEYRFADYGDVKFTAIPYVPGSSYGAAAEIDVESNVLEIGAAYSF